MEDFSYYKLRIPRSSYLIDLNGNITNSNTNYMLNDNKDKSGARATLIYYKPQQIKDSWYNHYRLRRQYKRIMNARTMIDLFLSIGFKYKIKYLDGDKLNTRFDNLKIVAKGGFSLELKEVLPLVVKNYRIANNELTYDKPLIILQ